MCWLFVSFLLQLTSDSKLGTQDKGLQNGHGSCPWGAHRHLDGLKLLLQMCRSEQERIILWTVGRDAAVGLGRPGKMDGRSFWAQGTAEYIPRVKEAGLCCLFGS